MTPASHRNIATLKLPKTPAALLKRAEVIAAGTTGNALLPSPRPTLATLNADIAAANAAETLAKGRNPGAATTRNAKCAIVVADLQQMRAYVQEVADLTPLSSAEIIESAGMFVRKVTARVKPPFAAKQGPVSGSIALAVRAAGRRVSYEWEMSPDQKTWTTLPATVAAKTSVLGLAPASTVFFRYRVVGASGAGDWSQTLSIIVK